MMVYSSIAISEPIFVSEWSFPNRICEEQTREDVLVEAFEANDTAFGFVRLCMCVSAYVNFTIACVFVYAQWSAEGGFYYFSFS